jgi:YD repeat-containing protein
MGRTTSITLPAYTPPGGTAITSTSSTTYNTQGLPATTTDGLGNATTYSYDKYGRLLTRTEPDPDAAGPKTSPVWQYTYWRDGSQNQTTDPVGAKTAATYDVLGRQVTSAVTEGAGTYWWTTNLAYDDAGHQKTSTSPAPHSYVTTTEYNTAGEPTKVTDHTGRFTRTTYDLAGRVVETVAARAAPTPTRSRPRCGTWPDARPPPRTAWPHAASSCTTCAAHRSTSYDLPAGAVATSADRDGRPPTL